MNPVVYDILKALILPPGNIIVFATAGMVLYILGRRSGLYLLILSITALYVFSTPVFARFLVSRLEQVPVLDLSTDRNEGKAIVVLGCGRYPRAREYGRDEVSACSLVRVRYAMEVAKHRPVPILLSGGSVHGEELTEAELMAMVMADFDRRDLWLENGSRNTVENARNSAELLRGKGIDSVYLVTHATHMRRAAAAFEEYGIKVIPAPTHFYTSMASIGRIKYLPTILGLEITQTSMHEILGMVWQRYFD
jgi:uncharacterized SAM-binding protein YcdF (DUF218 family)